ncbi:uncharacterized protein STEHIDRAFT_154732 [Stereum hirsutum FP-91666 SS1]|uniref:uncharacterized protein n=1 Tax=Stereum hirsutum (strain FP-91666) TaxID=721885 RepID=UPI000440C5E2|nr:uncharacterized protein STEHIDRAFT_154732 [Stereum hirsutum FP-91666 SS1]EIM89040.1 hypothetical protein STEHIDRAFT_154732 [Stereum hirsutum FP-91666 SS1]
MLLVIYPVLVVYAFTFADIQSVFGAALLVIILLLLACDWITLHRRVPAILWIAIDVALVGTLIVLCTIVDSDDSWWDADYYIDLPQDLNVWQQLAWASYPFFYTTLWIPRVVGGLYVIYLFTMSCRNWKIDGHPFRRFFATQTTLSSPRPRGSAPLRWIAGRRRSEEEKHAVKQKCTQAFFRYSLFRKHPFEPALLGIVRGLVAMWATLGLLGYLVFLIYQQQTTASSTSTINRSLVSIDASGWDETIKQWVYLGYDVSDIFVETTSSELEGKITIQLNGVSKPPNDCNGTTANWSLPPYSTIDCLYLSYIGNEPLSVWILGSIGGKQDEVFPVARNYTSPFTLQPNTHVVGSVTVTKREYGKTKWFAYTPRTNSPDISTFASNTSSMNLNTSLPASTEWIISEEIVHTSIAGEALKIISTIGGIHVVVNGIFFVIFGRSLLAVLFGGKPLSPFGVSGLFPSFRDRIHKHYPVMEDDLKAGGMASFVEEVAMDIGVLRVPKRRPNVQSSSEATVSNNSAEMQPLRVPGEVIERFGGTA